VSPNYAVPPTETVDQVAPTPADLGPGHYGALAEAPTVVPVDRDPLRLGLIGLVGVLIVVLGVVSFLRFGGNGEAPVAADTTTTTSAESTTTVLQTTIAPAITSEPTTSVPTTTTTPPSSTTTTASTASGQVPSAPNSIEVINTTSTGAEIRWQSAECVGSRYQVGDFEPGGGGYPDVNRCWFNHVILAGDSSFSPPLSPNTSYTVIIQAVAEDGTLSEPAEVSFTTSS